MARNRTVAVLCLLSCLFVYCTAVQGAVAETKGTTAFTCSSSATPKDFKTEHCVPGESGTAFGHVAIAENTTTHITLTNKKTNAATNGSTPWIIKSTIAGSAIELVATSVDITGQLENRKAASGEHFVRIKGLRAKLTEVQEKLLGCKVTGKPGGAETIETTALTASTEGQEMGIKLQGEEGTLLAEFELTECVVGPLTLKLFGSTIGTPNGATMQLSHSVTTGIKGLRFQNAITGPIAGIEGTATVTGAHKVGEEEEGKTKPLSTTTVATP